MSTVKGEVILAREVQVGDRIVLPQFGSRVVLEIQEYDEETGRDPGPRLLIIYGMTHSMAYENSGRKGKYATTVEQQKGSIRPLKPDDEITIEPSEWVAIERRT